MSPRRTKESLNVLKPRAGTPAVPLPVLAAFLNSAAADAAFRCLSGSVAVSAYELAALPLPPKASLGGLRHLDETGAPHGEIEAEYDRIYASLC